MQFIDHSDFVLKIAIWNDFSPVEIASRNELGLHTSWKIAMNDWDSPLKTTPLVKIDGAILTVKQSGLYFIYAQVNWKTIANKKNVAIDFMD